MDFQPRPNKVIIHVNVVNTFNSMSKDMMFCGMRGDMDFNSSSLLHILCIKKIILHYNNLIMKEM
jgi:hypothetical protein